MFLQLFFFKKILYGNLLFQDFDNFSKFLTNLSSKDNVFFLADKFQNFQQFSWFIILKDKRIIRRESSRETRILIT